MFSFDEASLKGKEVMDGVLKSYSEVAKGFQAIATEAADYSQKSFQNGIAQIEAVSSVKSPEAIFELQAAYAREVYESAVSGFTRFGELYADLAKTAYKPFESPISVSTPFAASPAEAPVAAEAVNAA